VSDIEHQAEASRMTGGLIPHPLVQPLSGGPFHSPLNVALHGRLPDAGIAPILQNSTQSKIPLSEAPSYGRACLAFGVACFVLGAICCTAGGTLQLFGVVLFLPGAGLTLGGLFAMGTPSMERSVNKAFRFWGDED
jgi:hypothetical protein